VGVISRQKRRLQKSYNIDYINPPCSKTHMCSAKLVKIFKSQDLFQTHKESLDNLLLTFRTYLSGDVHRAIHDLWPQFHKEHVRHSLGNLTKTDPVCQFLRKLDGKPIPDS
jgi:hypothetical protein